MRRVQARLSAITRSLSATVHHIVDGEQVEELFVRVAAMDIESFGRPVCRQAGTARSLLSKLKRDAIQHYSALTPLAQTDPIGSDPIGSATHWLSHPKKSV